MHWFKPWPEAYASVQTCKAVLEQYILVLVEEENLSIQRETHGTKTRTPLRDECNWAIPATCKDLGPVVRQPINVNPRLKVNRGFLLAR